MTLPEGIAFGSLIIAYIGFIYKTTKDEQNKRSRIYVRLDEVKQNMEAKLQTKEICDIHIKSIDTTLQEIKIDVKKLLKENGK